ncbi:MAG: zinc ribbon domain-containing protein [Actinomycetota bacterium]|nr:zinc ribbon domain-containing protein [Actinomycetota bacterium]MDA8317623.1 zinc ribbon domain-containing protein [Actinomycetota bacterium]
MADSPHGPGWWQASDDKWYPPEDHPDYRPPPPKSSRPDPPTHSASGDEIASGFSGGTPAQPRYAAATAGAPMPKYHFDARRLATGDRLVGVATLVLFVALFLPWAGLGFFGGYASVLALDGWMYLVFLVCLATMVYLALRAVNGLELRLPLPHRQVLAAGTGFMLFLTLIAFLTIPTLPHWSLGAFLGLVAAGAGFVGAIDRRLHPALSFSTGTGQALLGHEAAAVSQSTTGAPVLAANTRPGAKSKVVAILLAVFLGPWTWLYTYARDAKKFWIGIGVVVAWIVFYALAVSVFVTSAAVCTTYSKIISGACTPGVAVATGFGLATLGAILAGVVFPGIWIWAIVDTAIKSDEFYENYPGTPPRVGPTPNPPPPNAGSGGIVAAPLASATSDPGPLAPGREEAGGATFASPCPGCGAVISASLRFCTSCGASLG